MNSNTVSILIAYPYEFGCYDKFKRKVDRILSSLEHFDILYLDDPRNFIQEQFRNEVRLNRISKLENLSDSTDQVTHGILFDDGSYFADLRRVLESHGAVLRVVKIQIARVVNIDAGDKYDAYIGRGSGWGNPYAIGFDGDREEVIRKFKYDFERDFLKGGPEFKKSLLSLMGKRLGCHCRPLACHGDVLVEYLNSHDDEK